MNALYTPFTQAVIFMSIILPVQMSKIGQFNYV